MSIDIEFAELIAWIKARNLEARTTRGQMLIIRPRSLKRKLEVRNGRLVAK